MRNSSRGRLPSYFSGQFLLLIYLSVFFQPSVHAQEIGKAKYWIFFSTRKEQSLNKINESALLQRFCLSERSLARRRKVLPDDKLVMESDLPVEREYLSGLARYGFYPVMVSRWLHAASFYLSENEKRLVETLPYVTDVRHVTQFRKPVLERVEASLPMPKGAEPPADLDYGPSLQQNEMILATKVHSLGIRGQGILIGMMDTGFNLNHQSLEDVDVIAEWDFINNDGCTANESGDLSGQDNHGTQVLSVIAGYYPQRLIGTAYEAQFALAKTERPNRELAIEEDYWIAGIEWLDSVGVDVVSSSLGYADRFEDRYPYTFSQMDGKTARTTIAAQAAVERGIVVAVSAGNERETFWGHIISPSDAPGVIAVGSVSPSGLISYFSSPGPSADGRIKPDCVALGEEVQGVRFTRFGDLVSNDYEYIYGTSAATPQVAGAAALILEAHPNLTPEQVMEAIHSTGERSQMPDNDYGYGLVNAYRAVLYHGPAFGTGPLVVGAGTKYQVSQVAAAEGGFQSDGVQVHYQFNQEEGPFTSVTMEPGTEPNWFVGEIPAVSLLDDSVRFYFTAADAAGKSTRFPAGEGTFSAPLTEQIPEQFEIMQNFPNPFNERTKILVLLPEEVFITLKIYSILGEEVRTLVSKRLSPGKHVFTWDGRNEKGLNAASGVYIYRFHSSRFTQAKKMLYIR